MAEKMPVRQKNFAKSAYRMDIGLTNAKANANTWSVSQEQLIFLDSWKRLQKKLRKNALQNPRLLTPHHQKAVLLRFPQTKVTVKVPLLVAPATVLPLLPAVKVGHLLEVQADLRLVVRVTDCRTSKASVVGQKKTILDVL
uniref:Histone domain-containing protein n=1 Tax=Mesocestoides corti TaxID=53468 RepID=A0A5K3EK74_MESCO